MKNSKNQVLELTIFIHFTFLRVMPYCISGCIQETDFLILGSNVSYMLGYFPNSRLKFLNSFLKHATELKFLQVGNFSKTLCCRHSVWSGI